MCLVNSALNLNFEVLKHATPQIGHQMEHHHKGLIHPGFIRGSDSLQCHGTSGVIHKQ